MKIITIYLSIGAPAPPPPPPGGRGGPPPPPPSSSKPSSTLPVIDEARGNLMASIRTGFQLKHVSMTMSLSH